jgi:hypothetical protein
MGIFDKNTEGPLITHYFSRKRIEKSNVYNETGRK